MTRPTVTPQRRALVFLVLVAVVLSVTAAASALSPHADPAANLTLPSSLLAAQQTSCLTRPIDNSAACTRALLAEVNYGLAIEGLAPISLPGNWAALTTAEQIFVIVDLERVARGLQPFLGMSFIWGADAQMGATDNGDKGRWIGIVSGEKAEEHTLGSVNAQSLARRALGRNQRVQGGQIADNRPAGCCNSRIRRRIK